MTNTQSTTFLAELPDMQSAIKVAGRDGMRITLDVAESDVPQAMMLIGMRNQRLRVTVSVEKNTKSAEMSHGKSQIERS